MRNFLAPLFGGTCFLCRGAARAILCKACDADLPRLAPPRCPRCALESPRAEVCGRCLSEAPHYDATVAALAYEFPADALVHALKFRGELALRACLEVLLRSPNRCVIRFLCPDALRSAAITCRRNRALARRKLDVTGERIRDTPPQMDAVRRAPRNARRVPLHAPLAGARVACR
jgi:predicted amidophosphoribosyltransferase